MHRIRLLGATVIVGLLAVGAYAAPASGLEVFTANSFPVAIKGVQHTGNKFFLGKEFEVPREIDCTEDSFSSREPEFILKESSSLLLWGQYGHCLDYLGGVVEIGMQRCLYSLTLNKSETATVGIKNPTGTKSCEEHPFFIKIPSTGCEVALSAQTGLSAVSFKPEANETWAADFKLGKIAYKVQKAGPLCPGAGEVVSYEGEDTFSGKSEAGAAIGIWIK